MEPLPYSLQAVLRVVLILGLSLTVFAQIPAAPDASGFPSGRKAPDFPLTVLSPVLNFAPAFEFRGIRIGDEMKEAERKFLALKVPSLSSKPGLCGSDGISRIETCTDVLDTGEYVNMTMLDRRVAQIYVSTDRHTQGNTYNISNEVGRVKVLRVVFSDFEHTFHVSSHALVPFERVTILRR